jgi:hypothetical protein
MADAPPCRLPDDSVLCPQCKSDNSVVWKDELDCQGKRCPDCEASFTHCLKCDEVVILEEYVSESDFRVWEGPVAANAHGSVKRGTEITQIEEFSNDNPGCNYQEDAIEVPENLVSSWRDFKETHHILSSYGSWNSKCPTCQEYLYFEISHMEE